MCFGKADDSASKQAVAEQKSEAAEARQKEADRQARIAKGMKAIKDAFEGKSKTATRSKTVSYDDYNKASSSTKSGDQVSGLPSGYKYVWVSDNNGTAGTAGTTTSGGGSSTATSTGSGTTAATAKRTSSGNTSGAGGGRGGGATGTSYYGTGRSGDQSSYASGQSGAHSSSTGTGGGNTGSGGYSQTSYGTSTAGTSGTASTGSWGIQGPDGKIYKKGDTYTGSEDYETGERSGGFDDAYYNKYKQGIIDYYMPQVAQKYSEAKDETTYRLARAGTLRSSVATDKVKDLSEQNTQNEANVRSGADSSTANLKSRVASERAKAENQLYSTEDPDVASNSATSSVSNLFSEKADTTPLGDIFTLATIGSAGALSGYGNARYRQQAQAIGKQKSTNVTS